MNFRSIIVAGCFLSIALIGTLHAQDTGRRTQDLVAALDKTKYKSKEKKGIKVEVYVDIKNEAVVKSDPAEYSGVYAEDLGLYRLELRIAHDGRAEGSGFESSLDQKPVHFTLRDARIDGALLTATRVFDNGKTDQLEAVFVAQNLKAGTSPSKIEEEHKEFGLGYIQRANGESTSRVFLVRK
jgi:hypothetical protein